MVRFGIENVTIMSYLYSGTVHCVKEDTLILHLISFINKNAYVHILLNTVIFCHSGSTQRTVFNSFKQVILTCEKYVRYVNRSKQKLLDQKTYLFWLKVFQVQQLFVYSVYSKI